jgi:hypothetical protein
VKSVRKGLKDMKYVSKPNPYGIIKQESAEEAWLRSQTRIIDLLGGKSLANLIICCDRCGIDFASLANKWRSEHLVRMTDQLLEG